jgi:hypothetical protein
VDENPQIGIQFLASDKKTLLSRSCINVYQLSAGTKTFQFTVEPRKILAILKTVELHTIKLSFEEETKTLSIYTSPDNTAFIALPSRDPAEYPPIEEIFTHIYNLQTVNAGVLLSGIQFIDKFLDPKHPKFSNLFIVKGSMYGANGDNKAGAFTGEDLKDLDELTFPASCLNGICNFINNLDLKNVSLGTTSNGIFISSSEQRKFSFGFTKVKVPAPRIPITTEDPTGEGWLLDREMLLKRLNRLHITGDAKLGVQGYFSKESLHLTTVTDRASKDILPCKSIGGVENKDTLFLASCRLLESVLKQFGGRDINFYVDKKITLYTKISLEILEAEGKIIKPCICAAAISQARPEKTT